MPNQHGWRESRGQTPRQHHPGVNPNVSTPDGTRTRTEGAFKAPASADWATGAEVILVRIPRSEARSRTVDRCPVRDSSTDVNCLAIGSMWGELGAGCSRRDWSGRVSNDAVSVIVVIAIAPYLEFGSGCGPSEVLSDGAQDHELPVKPPFAGRSTDRLSGSP